MRIRLGCRFDLQLTQPTPMIALLNVHFSRAGDLEAPDRIVTTPSVPLNAYRDMFGNWCTRLVAPAGVFSIGVDAFVHDSGAPDEAAVVSRMLWKFPGGALRACEGSVF